MNMLGISVSLVPAPLMLACSTPTSIMTSPKHSHTFPNVTEGGTPLAQNYCQEN